MWNTNAALASGKRLRWGPRKVSFHILKQVGGCIRSTFDWHEKHVSASAPAPPGGAIASSPPRSTPSEATSIICASRPWPRRRSRRRRCASAAIPSFPGYDTYLDDRMQAVLPACLERGTKIVTNQGWINPDGAAERIVYWLRRTRRARRQGRRGLRQPDHRPRAGADRHDHGERPADLHARAEPGVRRGLSRRGADRRGAQAGRAASS